MKFVALVPVFLIVLAGCGSSGPAEILPDSHLESYDFPTKDVQLASFKGKVTVIDFWATWCGPCRETIPTIQELQDDFKDKGLVVLGISSEGRDRVEPFVKTNELTYTFLRDPNGDLARKVNAQAIPTLLLVDKAGNVVFRHVGSPIDRKHLRDTIEKLL